MPDRALPVATRRPGYRSIFFKLFIVLLGAVIITYLSFGGFYRADWNSSNRAQAYPSQIHYWKLLSDEIGSPPDTALAGRLSDELGLAIGIHNAAGDDWRTPDVPDDVWNKLIALSFPESTNVLLREGRVWAPIDRNGYTYVYGSRRRTPLENFGTDWMILFLVTTLGWLLAWRTLYRMLQPLRWLERGVEDVTRGNLDVRLSEKGNDELAGLARSFNVMTLNLKERLKARDQLLLDVSHELRSPLTRMRVALEMAAPGMAVDSLREEVVSLEKMVTEILETERLNSPAGKLKCEPADLNALVSESVPRFAGRDPGISWTPGAPMLVPMDLERMRLVVHNLLDNALKYGKSSRPVEVTLGQEKNFALLEVRDFGPGIPEEEQRLVFEPFYRMDRSRSRSGGYGLGLPLCKRVVKAHGGILTLHSRANEGTRMTVRLPMG